jgi:hypothetical protein
MFLALSESSASVNHTISPKAVPLLPLIEPCVRFSRTRLSDGLLPPAFACAWLCGIASSEVIEFGRTTELALKGIRSSYPLRTREQSNAPSLRLGYVVPIILTTVGVSDSSIRLPFPFHQVMAYRVGYVKHYSTTRGGLPSFSINSLNIPRPIHRRVLRRCISKFASRLLWSSSHTAGLDSLLARLREYTLTMRQASLNVTDC